MAQTKRNGFSDFMKAHVEMVQDRISEFQKEADKLAADLSARGQAQVKELEKLVKNFETSPLAARSAEFADKAKVLGEEFVSHLDDLQGKLAKFVGVATRDQVADVARELKNLSKKVDGITSKVKSGRSRVA